MRRLTPTESHSCAKTPGGEGLRDIKAIELIKADRHWLDRAGLGQERLSGPLGERTKSEAMARV